VAKVSGFPAIRSTDALRGGAPRIDRNVGARSRNLQR